MNYFTQHLNDINESYFTHLGHALRFAGTMAVGSLACLIHAIFPFLCVKTGSKIINTMHHDMVIHRDQLKDRSNNTEKKRSNSPVTTVASM